MENVTKFRRKHLLVQVAQELHADLSSGVLIKKVCARACEFAHGELARVFYVDSGSDQLKLLSAVGETLVLNKGEGLVGYCALHKTAMNVPDVYKDPNFSSGIDMIPQVYCKTICCMPLVKDEQVVGVLQVLKRHGVFSEDDLTLLKDLSSITALALTNTVLVEANKTDHFGALTMLIAPNGTVLRVNRDPQTVIGVSRADLMSQPLRQCLSLNPDLVTNCEKAQTSGSPVTVVNSLFQIKHSSYSLDYSAVPSQGDESKAPGHVWLVISRVSPIRPNMEIVCGKPALDIVSLKSSDAGETVVCQGVVAIVHFFIASEHAAPAHEAEAKEQQEDLQKTVEEYLPACMDILAGFPQLGVLERFEGTTMTFMFGLPRATDADIAQGCELAFGLRDGLAGINKQRAIMGLASISTCTMVKTADMECGPDNWAQGPLCYDWLDKSISDLLPVTMHYGVQGVLVADQILPSVGVGCVSREIDNVFLPFSGLHCCVHEVIGRSAEDAPSMLHSQLQLYADGLAAYRARRWITAIDCFQKLVKRCDDRPSKAMIQHCHHWIKRDVGSYWDTSWELFDEQDDNAITSPG
eukprot:TRINITY_DN6376_c0_g1_i5.p1 TRINITY_DN6376_c0_g1~~TRINITY_DN6376_c0_g1_i5.p1  ORF type:complete len:581 (-),score=189.70 TRINITY_DN6376_c0_g1_i5:53-1795(-)